MQLSITSNVGLVRQGLQDLTSEVPKIGRRKIFDGMNRITREMEGYPAERPYQTYHRTGNYGASWRLQRLDAGYRIENTARYKGKTYGHYVAGNAYGTGQAWMHQGRWPVFRDVVDAEMEKLPEEVAREMNMVARRVMPQ